MSHLYHTDSLALFEDENPSDEEVMSTFESYAEDQLESQELLDSGLVLQGDPVKEEGRIIRVNFADGESWYSVHVTEWDTTQGVAIPLVELRSFED
jgi:hypothetical protein